MTTAKTKLGDWDVAPIGRVAAPLREQVIEMMRAAIRDLKLLPGQRLIERELIQRFGVSRTTIREALRDLASEGLVTVIPQKGAIVAAPSAEEAADLYDVRAHLESLAIERFVYRATPEQVAQLRGAVDELSEIAENNPDDTQGMLQVKDHFYTTLIEGAGNAVLNKVLGSLRARVQVLRSTSLRSSGRPAESAKELRAIMDAIERSDGEVAARLCAQHIENAARTALQALMAEEQLRRRSTAR